MPIASKAARVYRLFVAGLFCAMFAVGAGGAPSAETTSGAVETAQIAYLRLTDGYWQVWITDSRGSFHRQLTSESVDKTRLSWSGARRALLVNSNDGELVELTLDGDPTPIKLPHDGILDAAWSADGRRIAFSMNATQTTDNNDLWVINTDGSAAKKLTNQPGVVQAPTWHPDGRSLVYSLGSARNYVDLWRVDLSDGSKEQLTVAGNRYFSPAYTPMGSLLYTREGESNFDIWEMDAAGKQTQLTTDAAYDAEPSGASDGEQVAFFSLRDETRRIWVMNKKTGATHAVTPADAQSRHAVWLN